VVFNKKGKKTNKMKTEKIFFSMGKTYDLRYEFYFLSWELNGPEAY